MSGGETYTVSEIREDLEASMNKTAAAADEAATDGDFDDEAALESWGETLCQRAVAFDNLADEYGADATIRIKDLSGNDRVDFGELLAAAMRQWEEQHGVEPDGRHFRTVYWVAAGIVEAPWLQGDDGLQDRAVALRSDSLPDWPAIKQLRTLVTDVNALNSGNVTPFSERRSESSATAPTTEQS
jgi:hypothetical protein